MKTREEESFFFFRGVKAGDRASGDEELVDLVELLLGQNQAVHLFLSGGAGDGDAADKRGASLLLFLGLCIKQRIVTAVLKPALQDREPGLP